MASKPKRKKQPGQVTKPTKHTAAQVEAALRAAGGLMSLAAKKLKVSPSTVTRYFTRWPHLDGVLDEIKGSLLDLGEAVVIGHMRQKNLDAAKFYLREMGRGRGYGLGAGVNVIVPPGGNAIPSGGGGVIVLPDTVSEEEWLARAERYKAIAAKAKPAA